MGVFDDARTGGGFRGGGAFPFVTAGDALIAFGVFQNLGHLAHRTGWLAHKKERKDYFASESDGAWSPSEGRELHPPGLQTPDPGPWSRKSLVRLIVTSATYRQSSNTRPELAERDPFNILLARQARLRVESEILRDLHLATAGLLNDDIGGPPFRPFMPEDIRKLGAAGAFSWDNSSGPDLYRRGLYIFAQRTVPYPTAMTFDQADSCESCAQRDRSTTPLQALTLMNHALFVECARALAKRIAALPARAPRDRIEAGFQLCLSRPPSRAELDRLEPLFADELALAPDHTGPAAQEHAFTQLAQVLLNLDEFLTRE